VENSHRLKEVGLYRVSGSRTAVERLKDLADRDAINFVIEPHEDTHNVTGVLKLYLREMLEPLIPYKLYPSFIEAAAVTNIQKRDEAMQIALKALPQDNRVIFDRLFYHLHKVTAFADENKMDSKNLALVFAPNILRPNEDSLGVELEDSTHSNNLVAFLIDKPDFYLHPNLVVSPRAQYTFNDLDSTTTLINNTTSKNKSPPGPPSDDPGVPPAPMDSPEPPHAYTSLSAPTSPYHPLDKRQASDSESEEFAPQKVPSTPILKNSGKKKVSGVRVNTSKNTVLEHSEESNDGEV
jgi:hypothetical protein